MSGAADDERFMAAAIRLSRRNTGLTSTNPSVACLIVRDGIVHGAAVTAPGGRPHAETQALAQAGEAARGGTAYVTLEPCSHHGKTPPCADALVAAGVARVVVAVSDPDPRVSGRGLAILKEAGIEVEAGLLEEEGRRALAGYLMRQTNGRPYVTLKLALSADGMLGRPGEEVAITGPVSRAQVHALRAETDAILVGIGTAMADDPELTTRLPGLEERSPVRIVLDPRLELPPATKLAKTAGDVAVIAVAAKGGISPAGSPFASRADGMAGAGGNDRSADADSDFPERRAALEAMGVEILQCDPRRLDALLYALGTRGISSLLVEGGARTAQAFLDAGLVDRILLFRSPDAIGEGGLESPITPSDMPSGFRLVRESAFGRDRCLDYERVS
ncbi:MAG: bifunctional diaminohydroxyphosphoribosylaminopyrimidine deaminase/5-amino-6-(5-phosphoribosylamino)uracil reductase RibD [Shinella sp.]|nr:bifunctional diaminohydroxyphosphoribosylaminopyrimidine deaminase/5-amino-6-(5-phosphoribosylamino)uracil reductase RibD [Shinella sp.]